MGTRSFSMDRNKSLFLSKMKKDELDKNFDDQKKQ